MLSGTEISLVNARTWVTSSSRATCWSSLPRDQAKPALRQPGFERFTPRTITDSKALAREIERVRERGYAQAIEEREPGLSAIAVPVRSSRGELDAIVALQGPSSRFDKKAIGAALPVLLEQGRAISRELGWRAD